MHWHVRMCIVLHTDNSLIASSVLPFCHSTTKTLASLLIPKQDRQYPCVLCFPSTWRNSVRWLHGFFLHFLQLCIYSTSLMRSILTILFTILIYSPTAIPLNCPSLFSPMTYHLLAYYKIYC